MTLRDKALAVAQNPSIGVLRREFTEPQAQFIAACSPPEILKLLDRVDRLEEVFHHTHVNSQDGTDACAECGLDLRDSIHFRVEKGVLVYRPRKDK